MVNVPKTMHKILQKVVIALPGEEYPSGGVEYSAQEVAFVSWITMNTSGACQCSLN
jgi:hypothetical protein